MDLNAFFEYTKAQCFKVYDFMGCAIKQFIKDDCFSTATSLAYASLFSLMPVLIIGYTVFTGFPEFEQLGPKIESLLLNNFVPEVVGEIQQVGQRFMQQASELSLTGFLGLLMVALWMIYTIEQSFNYIWHTRKLRDGVSAFLLYWAVITLTPILLAAGISISTHIAALPFIAAASHFAWVKISWILIQYGLTAFAFGMLYFLVPNCKVRAGDALLGGVFAMGLFEVTKKLLVIYITRFTRYKFLYGAVAAVPIFLLWLYLFWLILLCGAQVAHMAGLFSQGKRFI